MVRVGSFDAFSAALSLFVHGLTAPEGLWSLAGGCCGGGGERHRPLVPAQIEFLLRAA